MSRQSNVDICGKDGILMRECIRREISKRVVPSVAWSDTGLRGNIENIDLQPFARFTLDAFKLNNRISCVLKSQDSNAIFGIQFRNFMSSSLAKLTIDKRQDQMCFYFEGEGGHLSIPRKDFTLDVSVCVNLEICLKPSLGAVSVYVNDCHTVGFHLYDLMLNQVGIFTENSELSVIDLKRYTS